MKHCWPLTALYIGSGGAILSFIDWTLSLVTWAADWALCSLVKTELCALALHSCVLVFAQSLPLCARCIGSRSYYAPRPYYLLFPDIAFEILYGIFEQRWTCRTASPHLLFAFELCFLVFDFLKAKWRVTRSLWSPFSFETCILQKWQLRMMIRRCPRRMDKQRTGVCTQRKLHGFLLRPPPRNVICGFQVDSKTIWPCSSSSYSHGQEGILIHLMELWIFWRS